MRHTDRTGKWIVTGVVVAVALGSIGVASAGTSGPAPAFTAITPCRLMDTRPAFNVGSRATPLGENEEADVQVHGTNGDCTIPTDATAITANVIAVNPTAPSFLSIWPADQSNPGTSSLNYLAGQPPTPNTVSVALSTTGGITLLNRFGSVDVVIDISGYFADHTHDDRYYTKSQVDSAIAAVPGSDAYSKSEVDALLTPKANAADVYTQSEVDSLAAGLQSDLDDKANAADVYTQAEVDALLPTTSLVQGSFTCSLGGGCAAGTYSLVTAPCPAAHEATGGSAIRVLASTVEEAHPSRPSGTPPMSATGWQGSNQVALANGDQVVVFAVCATIES